MLIRTHTIWDKSLVREMFGNFTKLPNFICQTFWNSTTIICIVMFSPILFGQIDFAKLSSYTVVAIVMELATQIMILNVN